MLSDAAKDAVEVRFRGRTTWVVLTLGLIGGGSLERSARLGVCVGLVVAVLALNALHTQLALRAHREGAPTRSLMLFATPLVLRAIAALVVVTVLATAP